MRRLFPQVWAACLTLLFSASVFMAMPVAAEDVAAEPISFDIPAQPLDQAVTELARQAGLTLGGDSSLLRGKQAPALKGEYTPADALRLLLDGSGIRARFAEDRTVTLVEAESANSEPTQLGAITVEGTADQIGFRARNSSTATNVDAPLIETPATVNVLTRDFLDTIKPRRFEDTLAYIPGAGQEITFGNSDPVFNLRGFSTTSREGGIFVDGYQLNRRSYVPDLSLYERVDILKGTSGVLYGTARPGGVVNYVRKKPLFNESFNRVEGTVGSFDTFRGSIDSTGRISDSVAYRLIATRQEANQTIHGDNDSSVPDDRTVVNAGLTWRTPLQGEARFNYEYYFIDQVFDPGIQFINGAWTFNREPLTNPDQFSEREYNIFRFEYDQPIGNKWNAFFGTKYDDGDTRRFLDAAVTGPLDGSPVGRFTDRTVEEYEQLEFRGEIKGKFSTGPFLRHQLTTGVNHFETNLDRGRTTAFQGGAIDPFAPDFSNPPALATPSPNDPGEAQDFEQLRLFAQDYISVGEKLKLITGISYLDFEQKDGDARNEDSEINYTVGAIYNANSWFNPYVSYSVSTEPQLGQLAGGGTLPPREAEQIEIGLKSQWFSERLITTLSVFEIEQTNKAEENPINTDEFILTGTELVQGLEFEATGQITPNLRLLAGYSYLDAEISDSVDPALNGNILPNIPEHKFSLFTVYDGLAGIAGLSAGFGVVHVGDRKAGNDNVVDLPTYTRGDVFMSYRRYPWTAELTVENITDEDYVAGTRPGFPTPDGTFQAAQGTPRFITFNLSFEF